MRVEIVVVKCFFHGFVVFREESSPKGVEREKEEAGLDHSPDPSFSNSPDPARLGQVNHQGEYMFENMSTLFLL